MPLFGAHLSIAGGLHKALLAAQTHGMATVQLFTKNASQWAARALTLSGGSSSPTITRTSIGASP